MTGKRMCFPLETHFFVFYNEDKKEKRMYNIASHERFWRVGKLHVGWLLPQSGDFYWNGVWVNGRKNHAAAMQRGRNGKADGAGS